MDSQFKGSSNVFIEDIYHLGFTYDRRMEKAFITIRDQFMPDAIVKLYPFEWLVNEMGQDELIAEDLESINTIEPAWKLILGNKAALPLLWEMFPDHENLLPAYFIDPVV